MSLRYSDLRSVSAILLGALLASCSADVKNPLGPGGGVGTLNLTVNGLPNGVAARVTVSGTLGTTRAVTASTQLTGLPQDNYTIAAGYVTSGQQAYSASVAPTTVVAVLANQIAQATVNYAPGATPSANLTIAGIQVIQSTQRSDNSVAMVAGRAALVRVFVIADQANSLAPKVRLRLFQGTTQVDSVTVTAPTGAVPLVVDTATLTSSWNLTIPANRVQPNLKVLAVVDPDDAVLETNETDNRFPVSGTPQSVTVQTVAALHVRFVPVIQGGLSGNVSNSNKDQLLALTEAMYPIGVADADVRASYTSSAGPLMANDTNGAWGTILSELYALQQADPTGKNYVGIAGTTYGGGVAGLGYIGAPAALAWDKAGSAPGVITHELGHNFGRDHAPCGVTGDPNYPYPGAKIGVWGYDQSAGQLRSPVTYVDVMSYCSPNWISDYNYQAIMTFRGVGPLVINGALPAAPVPGLLVWGRITPRGLELEPAFMVNAPASLPVQGGPYRVTGTDAAGTPLFDLSFAGHLVPDLPGGEERHFAFVVPLGTSAGRLVSLRLTDGRMVAMRQASPALTAQGAAVPFVAPSARRTPSGATEVRWDARYPMALVRDPATGEILSFARNGVVRIPAGPTSLDLEFSDGVTSHGSARVSLSQ